MLPDDMMVIYWDLLAFGDHRLAIYVENFNKK